MITLDAHLGARVLDRVATSPHQRVPLVIGSPEDVRQVQELYTARRT
jgi:fructose-1,6-bisphosphatase